MSFLLRAFLVVLASVVGCNNDVEPPSPARRQAVAAPTPEEGSKGRAQPSVPRLSVVQTGRPPVLDGSLSDPAWGFANATRAFVETRQGGIAPVAASAKLLWDRTHLYVGVDVKDALLRAKHQEHDDHLWEQDCVELMVDPDGDGKNYFEIQVSPRGVVFDTRYEGRRVPKPFGHTDWDSAMRVAVSFRGQLDDGEADAGYRVEMAVPWQAFSLKNAPVAPPKIGDRWRANLYVMDLTADRQQAAAWSPPGIGDFHVPARFGILAFEGPPEEMVGPSGPPTYPAGRRTESQRRQLARDRTVKDAIMKKRALERRPPVRRSPTPTDESAPTLESTEAAP